jgi:carbon-monoxide dehydrogenase small subunit
MMETHRRTIRFKLNGRPVSASIATHETLVEVLRRAFGLFGGRESCGQGLCGCCTALVNGLAVTGCLYLAAFVDEGEVVTVEGLSSGEELHPIQQSFISNCAFQCGFCTPGFILMTKELLDRHPQPTTDEIRHYLSGNLCRCAAYPDILKAVKAASK